LLNEESHHSKWEEFRRIAKQDIATEECSSLLSRMELEISEEEIEASDTEKMDEDEDLSSLQEEGFTQTELNKEALIIEEQLINKNQKRKNKWGPTLRFPRPRRYPEDGCTMLEKAQELKKVKNLETGTKHKSSFAFESSTSLPEKANIANISLGTNTCNQLEKIELLKQKELSNRREFEESNPETTLLQTLIVF
jgi:hypothetical protein